MRARLAIRQSGVTVCLREVALRSKPAQMLAISPKGTVPVLQLPDGRVLEQSLDIMRWACAQADPHGWLDNADTPQALQWLSVNDGPFKQLLDRYKYADRYPERSAQSYRDEALALHLAPLDQALSAHAFVMGPHASLVDAALMPFVRQFAQVDAAWFDQAPLPALRAWLTRWTQSELFEQTMRKFDVWHEGQPDLLF